MADAEIKANKRQEIEAVVVRCGCPARLSNEEKIKRHGRDPLTGAVLPCPTPRKVVDLGRISYSREGHPVESALVTAWIRIRRFINKQKEK